MACLASVFWASCRKNGDGDLRLADRLRDENVMMSPLRGLDRILPSRSQTVRGSDLFMAVVEGKKSWYFATEAPLSEPSDLENPAGAALLLDGKEVAFSPTPLKDAWSWRWEKGERTIPFFPDEAGSWREKKLDLAAGATFKTGGMFPPGPAVVELTAESGDPAASPVRLNLEINGENSGDIVLGGKRTSRWTATMRAGENSIRIAFDKAGVATPRKSSAGPKTARIHSLVIKSPGDMVLISGPAGKPPISGTFEFRYEPGPFRSIALVKKRFGPGEEWALDPPGATSGKKDIEVICRTTAEGIGLDVQRNGGPADSLSVPGTGYSSLVFSTGPEAGPRRLRFRDLSGEARPFPDVFIDAVVTTDPLEGAFGALASLVDELEVGENLLPEGRTALVRKIKFRGAVYEAILAPPPTELRFPVRVPESGVLQFGYGLVSRTPKLPAAVVFEVLVKDARGIRPLFQSSRSDRAAEGAADDNVVFRRIDLSRESGKEVTLIFRTRAAGGVRSNGRKMLSLRDGLAFWASPVIGPERGTRIGGQDRINVVYVSIDTLRADHLGCYGYPKPTSPAVDALARDGVAFLSAFSPAPYTLTSHMTALTGLDPSSHGVFLYDDMLAPETPTLAGILRDRGFRTAAFTGGSQLNASYGFAKGFDLYDERPGANELLDSATGVFDKASFWLEANRESRFFLFLHTYQPHNPYRSPAFPERALFEKKEFPWDQVYLQNLVGAGSPGLFRELTPLERENIIALYDIEIRYTDEYLVKPLVAKLKELGLYDRTMIVIAGDHGEEFYDHGSWEHVHTVYNELVRVPLVMKYPRSRFSGRRVDRVTGLVDIAPTVIEEAGFRRTRLAFDGTSLTGLVEGKASAEQPRLSYTPSAASFNGAERLAVIRSPFKLILNEPYSPEAYVFFKPPPPRKDPIELFDWVADPGERVNLAARSPGLVRELLKTAEAFQRKLAGSRSGRKLSVGKELAESLRSLGYIR